MNDNEEYNFHSYNSLSRRPLMFGIPVMLLVITLIVTLVLSVIAIAITGAYGLVIPIISVVGLFAVRYECQNESRAMEWKWWELKSWWDRVNCGAGITSFSSSSPESYREEILREWLKNNTCPGQAATIRSSDIQAHSDAG